MSPSRRRSGRDRGRPAGVARRWPLALAALLALGRAAVARADTPPSQWDIAADPALAERWALHVRVQRLLHPPPDDPTGPRLEWRRDAELHCEAALAMLEQAGAETSPDTRLRFDLGVVQYELAELGGRVDLYTKAAATLTAALALDPAASGATEALERIVYAYAKLDRPRDELDAWHRYIPRLLDPRTRAVAQMNRGEAEMRLGLVDDALGTFRQVLRESEELPNTSSTYVLALWDLAVALDRSGDARGALDTATRAAHETALTSTGMPSLGRALLVHDPAVFFVPDWEKQWYLALGAEALAREDTDPREAAAYFIESEHDWDQYIAQASAAGASGGSGKGRESGAALAQQSWLRIAGLRRARVHAARLAALKRLPAAAARQLEGGGP